MSTHYDSQFDDADDELDYYESEADDREMRDESMNYQTCNAHPNRVSVFRSWRGNDPNDKPHERKCAECFAEHERERRDEETSYMTNALLAKCGE